MLEEVLVFYFLYNLDEDGDAAFISWSSDPG